MQAHLEIGFELDRKWHLLRGENINDSETGPADVGARGEAIDRATLSLLGARVFGLPSEPLGIIRERRGQHLRCLRVSIW